MKRTVLLLSILSLTLFILGACQEVKPTELSFPIGGRVYMDSTNWTKDVYYLGFNPETSEIILGLPHHEFSAGYTPVSIPYTPYGEIYFQNIKLKNVFVDNDTFILTCCAEVIK